MDHLLLLLNHTMLFLELIQQHCRQRLILHRFDLSILAEYYQFGIHPRCVQIVEIATIFCSSARFTSQNPAAPSGVRL